METGVDDERQSYVNRLLHSEVEKSPPNQSNGVEELMELPVLKWRLGSPIEAPRETGTPLESVATTCYSKGSVDRLEGAARRRQATPLEPEMEEEETQHQRVQYSMHSSEHIYQVFTHL